MDTLRFETGKELVIQLGQAGQDAAIKGWDQNAVEVTIDGSPDQCAIEQHDNILEINSHIPLSISAPRDATVHIGQVSGDLLLRDLDGAVSVDTVHGDVSWRSGKAVLSVREVHGDLAVEKLSRALSVSKAHADVLLTRVHAANLGQVHGDVRARDIGDVKMGSVSGDVQASAVTGPLALEEGKGSFRGKDLRGGMNVHSVKGDMSLKTALTPGTTYSGRADGSVMARFPAESSARFTLEAKGTISAKLPQVEEQEAGRVVGQAGAGEAQVVLSAGGDLSVKVRGPKESAAPVIAVTLGESLAAQIEAQIAEHLGELEIDARTQREIDKAIRRAEREVAKAQRRVEREAARGEERARRAQERAARAARRVRDRVARRSRKQGVSFGPGRSARAPKVSEEEQLAVLRMLQEGKISAEQAEMLLQALEGTETRVPFVARAEAKPAHPPGVPEPPEPAEPPTTPLEV